MANVFRQILKHSVIYGIANVLSRFIGFLMIPVYTRFLSPADYGVVELLDLTVNVVGTVIGLRMNAAIYRFYYEYKDEKDRGELISTALLGVGGVTSIVVAGLCLSARQFSGLMFGTQQYTHLFVVAFATLLFQVLIEYVYVYLQVRQRSLEYGVVSLARLVLGLGLNIWLVVGLRMGPAGILYSGLITSAVIALLAAAKTFREVGVRFSYGKLRKMVGFGYPLIFSSISTFVITFSDRYFLNHFCTLAEVGIYSLSYKFGILISFLITGPFLSIWTPKRFEIAGSNDAKDVSMKTFTYFSIIVIWASLALSLIIRDLLRIITTEAFLPAYEFVPVILLGYVINAGYYHFSYGIYHEKKTKYIAYIWLGGAVVVTLLNFALIKTLGPFGAALAKPLSYLCVTGGTYLIAQRLYPIKYDLWLVGRMMLLGMAIYFAGRALRLDNPWASLAATGAVSLLFPAGIYWLGFLDAEDKRRLAELVRSVAATVRRATERAKAGLARQG